MQPFKVVKIINYVLHSQKLRVIGTVITEKRKSLIDCFVPQDVTRPVGLNDVLRVCIGPILKIVLEEKQHNSQHIKGAAVTRVIVHTNNLFSGVILLQNFEHLFQSRLGV